jgi:hypothetical protein
MPLSRVVSPVKLLAHGHVLAIEIAETGRGDSYALGQRTNARELGCRAVSKAAAD